MIMNFYNLIIILLNMLNSASFICSFIQYKDHVDVNIANDQNHFVPIVFVYIIVPQVCHLGLPDYIRQSLEQAIFINNYYQNGSNMNSNKPKINNVVMASNYKECPIIERTVDKLHGLIKIDTTSIKSNRTSVFTNMSVSVFQSDHHGELWITSAIRFFILEDIMNYMNHTEILHVEADNTLYGNLSSILSTLRNNYPLAATPLTVGRQFITASVFWISNVTLLMNFNNYMMELISNENNAFKNYLRWLRKYACCKRGGIDPDENGNGIKPFAINEMSMLAYYHKINPHILKLLPIVPIYNYKIHRPFANVSDFAPDGWNIDAPTGDGIWDPNSWGQWIGGTSNKRGRNKGFIDTSHIAGQAIITGKCIVRMKCGNQTTQNSLVTHEVATDNNADVVPLCYTAPYVKCGVGTNNTILTALTTATVSPWVPLWNLHIHSKHVINYRSVPCLCPYMVVS